MINKEDSLGWAMLMYELDDAKEHLTKLITDLQSDPEYDEANLRIDLGHVFAHLNRAWHRRDVANDFTDEQWEQAGQFPTDLAPIA
jgi:hypothetical protein